MSPCSSSQSEVWHRLGDLDYRTDKPTANKAYRSAVAIRERLAADAPAEPRFRMALSRSFNGLAISVELRRRAVRDAYRRSLELRLKLADEIPEDPDLLHGLGESLTLKGTTVTNKGAVVVDHAVTLKGTDTIIGTGASTFHNAGTVNLGTNAQGATLDIGGTVTLSGPGTLVLQNGGDTITAAPGGGTLINASTIAGVGNIGGGDAAFMLTNGQSGIINANGATALVIDNASPGSTTTLPANAIINAGIIEATGTGGLVIDATTIANANVDSHGNILDGTIEVAAHSHIRLDNATIKFGFVSVGAF